jgi:hypothetical protein
MKKHYSLITADLVVAYLRRTIHKAWTDKVELSVWSNGREQGYFVDRERLDTEGIGKSPAAVFAQQRNSDQVVVVVGDREQFDFQTHQPDEKLWSEDGGHLRYFDTPDDAANFIAAHLSRGL